MIYEALGKTRYIRRATCDCPAAQAAQIAKESDVRSRELEGRAIQYLMRSNIHIGRYSQMTFESWDSGRHGMSAKHLKDAIDYTTEVKPTGANLCYFWGSYGTGKTHLAVAALRKITYDHIDDDGQGWKPYLVDWAEHCSMVQQSWDNNGSSGGASLSEGQLWSLMKSADILLIDDIDKGRPTEWAMGKLYEVVQRRYMSEKPTIITANHGIEELQQIWAHPRRPEFVRDLGGAILSRFIGQLWGQINITGPDQRQIKGR